MDNEHKFDLALQLGNLPICYQLATEMENEQKWIQLSEVATKLGEFTLVQECLGRARAYGSLLLLASASSDRQLMTSIGEQSRETGQFNIAFLSNFVLGKLDQCLEILIENQRLPEAAFFARTYLPSQINRTVDLWREKLKQMNMERAAQSLANPMDYENLFPGLADTYKTEQFLRQETKPQIASDFQTIPVSRPLPFYVFSTPSLTFDLAELEAKSDRGNERSGSEQSILLRSSAIEAKSVRRRRREGRRRRSIRGYSTDGRCLSHSESHSSSTAFAISSEQFYTFPSSNPTGGGGLIVSSRIIAGVEHPIDCSNNGQRASIIAQ